MQAESSRAAQARSASVSPKRGRQRMREEDAYVKAIVDGMARQFLTENSALVLSSRLPSPYRRAILPSPSGQARAGIAYTELGVHEPPEPRPSVWKRAKRWAQSALERLLPAPKTPYQPLPHHESD